MGIMKVKRAMILLLTIGIIVVGGCVRYPDGHNGNGEAIYQLEITVEVAGEINSYDGMYYIVLDADEESIDGPGSDFFFWDDDFYYIRLDDTGFYFGQKKDETLQLFNGDIIGENKLQVTIALSDLEDPNSIDINVLTTDSDNNTYDYLDPYFTISTDLGSTGEGDVSEGSSGEGGADFDIIKVTAEITTLY